MLSCGTVIYNPNDYGSELGTIADTFPRRLRVACCKQPIRVEPVICCFCLGDIPTGNNPSLLGLECGMANIRELPPGQFSPPETLRLPVAEVKKIPTIPHAIPRRQKGPGNYTCLGQDHSHSKGNETALTCPSALSMASSTTSKCVGILHDAIGTRLIIGSALASKKRVRANVDFS